MFWPNSFHRVLHKCINANINTKKKELVIVKIIKKNWFWFMISKLYQYKFYDILIFKHSNMWRLTEQIFIFEN